MSVLEEFKAVYEAHIAELNAANDRAIEAVTELEKLSDKYGIPYYASVSPLGQSYQPEKYEEYQAAYTKEVAALPDDTEEDYEDDLLSQLTGDYPGEYVGWQHSSVC